MTSPDAAVDLDKLEELEREATPGNWAISDMYGHNCVAVSSGIGEHDIAVTSDRADADAAFIAAIRNAAPTLLRDVRELGKLLDGARHAMSRARALLTEQKTADAESMLGIELENIRKNRQEAEPYPAWPFQAQYIAMEAEVRRLRKLAAYARHTEECKETHIAELVPGVGIGEWLCTCGYDGAAKP